MASHGHPVLNMYSLSRGKETPRPEEPVAIFGGVASDNPPMNAFVNERVLQRISGVRTKANILGSNPRSWRKIRHLRAYESFSGGGIHNLRRATVVIPEG